MFVLITVTKFQQFGKVMRMVLKSSCEPRFNGAQLQPNVMASRTKTKRFFICRILYNDHSAPLCAMCSLSWAKIRKNSAQRLFAGLFFIWGILLSHAFFKKSYKCKEHSLFGILHSRKNRNIEPERALKSLKMGLKREIRPFWSVFFIFRPTCVILIKR